MDMVSKTTQPANLEGVRALVEFVSAYAKEMDFEVDRITNIRIAIEEVARNIIQWSYCEEPGEIEISCNADDNGNLFVTIVDWGKPFNMLLADVFPDVWDPDNKVKDRPSMKSIKKAFNNLEYKRGEKQNILVFIATRELSSSR